MPEVGQPWKDTVSVTDLVPVAAALRDKMPPVIRNCSFCDDQLPAGIVKHPECRGWVT